VKFDRQGADIPNELGVVMRDGAADSVFGESPDE
jgi:hypothetical protein